ncbi:MAG: hypothetical protein ACRDPW_02270, partial [Mycobacteriales bacterium]
MVCAREQAHATFALRKRVKHFNALAEIDNLVPIAGDDEDRDSDVFQYMMPVGPVRHRTQRPGDGPRIRLAYPGAELLDESRVGSNIGTRQAG